MSYKVLGALSFATRGWLNLPNKDNIDAIFFGKMEVQWSFPGVSIIWEYTKKL